MKKQHISILFLLFALNGRAQKVIPFAEVFVTENRTAISQLQSNRQVMVLNENDIKNSSSHTLTELLENTAGIDIRSRGAFGTQADIQVRGGSFEQTLILLNGVKFSDPQTGHHMLNLPISLLDIERIEILKGAAARVYGQNAYAGVVNIITKKSKDNSVRADFMYGQHNLNEQIISTTFSSGKIAQRLSLSRLASDGYKTNTDFNQQQVFYQAVYEKGNNQWQLQSGYLNKKMGANSFYTDRFLWQYEAIETGFGVLSFKKTNWLNLKANAQYRQLHDQFQLKRDTPSFSQNLHTNHVLAADVSIGDKNKLGYWNLGTEIRRENIVSSNLGNHQRIIASAFAEQQIKLGKWSLVPGVCFNNYSDYGFVAYPAMDIGYRYKDFTLAASAGKTFRVPTFTELYYTDGGKSSIGNPNLKPEQAISYEANAAYTHIYMKFQAAYFKRAGSEQIDWVKDSATAPSWKAVNLGNLNTTGYDVNYTLYLSQIWNKSPLRQLNLGYCQTEISKPAENSQVSRYVYDYLQNQFTATLQFKLYKAFESNLRIRHENRIGYAAYTLCDLKLQWHQNNFHVFAEASNLFNTSYVEVGKVEMPARWLRMGISYKLVYKKNTPGKPEVLEIY